MKKTKNSLLVYLIVLFCGCSPALKDPDNSKPDSSSVTGKHDSIAESVSPLLNFSIMNFNKLFRDTAFKDLHVFNYDPGLADIKQLNGYKPDSISVFENLKLKGIRVQKPFLDSIKNKELEVVYVIEYYALWRCEIMPGYYGYVIRIINPGGPHTVNGIWLYTYSEKKGCFTDRFEIAARTGEEGYYYRSESWITDINRDNSKDVITRSVTEEINDEGNVTEDTITAKAFNSTAWADYRVSSPKAFKSKYKLRIK